MQYLDAASKMTECCLFPKQTIQYHSNPSYTLTSNAEEADTVSSMKTYKTILELIAKNDVLLIIWDGNAKVESQETAGVTGKFGLGVQNEAGQRLIEFCQENPLGIAKNMDITRWPTPKSD